MHVDAYRLGSLDELDALDLDTSLEESVTVVEWGEGLAEVLSEDRLEVTLRPRPRRRGRHGGSRGGRGRRASRARLTVRGCRPAVGRGRAAGRLIGAGCQDGGVLVLALDTSADIAVALVADGATLASRVVAEQRRHAELLSPLISQVLSEAGVRPADLDAVAVGTGPAPFTGLRAGLVTARALGFAVGAPVHGVGSLEVLAAQAFAGGAARRRRGAGR